MSTTRIARQFNRRETSTEFRAPSMKRACFRRFLLNNCVPINKNVCFQRIDKVLIVRFQASALDQCHHLLINLSCKSASKPLNVISARSAVCFLQPILQLSKKSSRPKLRLRFLYCIYALRMHTNTARSIEAEHAETALRQWLPKQAFYKTFSHIRSGFPLSSNFWTIISEM